MIICFITDPAVTGSHNNHSTTIINIGHTPFVSLPADYYDLCVAYMNNNYSFNSIANHQRQGISVWGEIDPGERSLVLTPPGYLSASIVIIR